MARRHDIRHNDTKHIGLSSGGSKHDVVLSVAYVIVVLSFTFSFYFAECRYAECSYADCHYDECHYHECNYE